jgi:putative hemolysin
LREHHWSETLGRLALATGATIVPAAIDGENSRSFYVAGHLCAALRTALLPRELLAARQSRVQVTFRMPLRARGDAADVTETARQAATGADDRSCMMEAEVAALAADATLVQSGRYTVYCTAAREIPHTLQEIGRLRAITYRLAGEGSGSDVDLDDFDETYLHLFVWNHDDRCVVGAYRIGQTDHLVATRGVEALYTRRLFHYGPELIRALSPALELGRSFVRPEYQRNYQALLLLWRGIGAFVVRHPHYRVLFGPVSVSSRYGDASLSLLTTFLEQNHLDARLARMVTPTHPRPVVTPPSLSLPADIAGADRRLAQLDADGKGMPVLLRQYLKLNARALGFSADPAFGDVVDALMAIDLTSVSPAVLRRYFGAEGLAAYRSHHPSADVQAVA